MAQQKNVTFDMGELEQLAGDLIRSSKTLKREIKPVFQAAGRRGTQDARKRIRQQTRGIYTKHYPQTLGYNVGKDGTSVTIGSKPGRKQHFLAKILEYGTATSPPKPHIIPAGQEQAKVVEGAVARIVVSALAERGGGQ